MAQIKRLIAGINPNTTHPMDFMTPSQLFFPIGPGEVYGAKRDQHALTISMALPGQTAVNTINILVKQGLKTPGPCLADSVLAQLGYQRFGFPVFQPAKRPLKKIHVGIDNLWSGTGGTFRLRLTFCRATILPVSRICS